VALGKIIWEDSGSEPVRVNVYSCQDHIHVVARCPLTPDLGYHIVLPRGEAMKLAGTIIDGLEAPKDAGSEYDTSDMYIC
jgi:hypothetical protein